MVFVHVYLWRLSNLRKKGSFLEPEKSNVLPMTRITNQLTTFLRSVRLTWRACLPRPFQSTRSIHERFSRMHFLNKDQVRAFIPGPFFVFALWGAAVLFGIALGVIYLAGSW